MPRKKAVDGYPAPTAKPTEKPGEKPTEKPGEPTPKNPPRAGKNPSEKRGGKRRTTRKGNGAGWGGPANGADPNRKDRPLLQVGGPGRGKFSIAGEAKREATERRTEVLMGILWEIAHSEGIEPPARIQATNHLLNRILGMPAQMIVNATPDDLTDDERAAQLEAFRRTTLGSAVPERSDGVGDSSAGSDETDASAPSSNPAAAP